MWKLLVTAAILAAGAPAAAQSVKSGIEAWQRADYFDAVHIWRPLAEAGDSDAAFNLGQAYRLGRGVRLDLAMAQTWFERAARKGHLDAQTTLGLLLFDSGDRAGALRWLKSAAEMGEPRAMLIYGTALFNGDGVAQNRVLAYALISRAAAQGLAPAKSTLAEMDQLLPLDVRQRGVAIAQALAKPVKPATPIKPPKAAAKPATKPTAPAAITTAKGNWRVQLGAFAKRSSAEALFNRLAGSGPLAGRRPFFLPAGAVTRLQAGPFESRAAATAACARLAPQPCFPVASQ